MKSSAKHDLEENRGSIGGTTQSSNQKKDESDDCHSLEGTPPTYQLYQGCSKDAAPTKKCCDHFAFSL